MVGRVMELTIEQWKEMVIWARKNGIFLLRMGDWEAHIAPETRTTDLSNLKDWDNRDSGVDLDTYSS